MKKLFNLLIAIVVALVDAKRVATELNEQMV